MRIGVLALQGDFEEHLLMLQNLGINTVEVRLPEDLEGLQGLIIPGGESTAIGKLASSYDLMDPLRRFGQKKAIWGTCAGAIFLSKDAHRSQPLLGLMDIVIQRNAFGRQLDSFETELQIPVLTQPDRPFHAIFIRAPLIERVGKGVEIIARLSENRKSNEGQIVAARQDHLLATSFHPEISGDDRFHRYFLSIVEGK